MANTSCETPSSVNPKPPVSLPLATWMAVFTAIVSVGGIFLHIIGYAAHESYLAAWGIDAGNFPKSVEDRLIFGYVAFLDRSAHVLGLFGEQASGFLWIILALTIYIFGLLAFKQFIQPKLPLEKFRNVSKLGKVLITSFSFTAVGVLSVPAILLVTIIFISIPAFYGHSFGSSKALNEFEAFSLGCNRVSVHQCFELHKNGKQIVQGFLLDSSETKVAYYDPQTKSSHSIERAGTEYIAYPPKLEEVSKKGRQK